jgi:hypothetical protein
MRKREAVAVAGALRVASACQRDRGRDVEPMADPLGSDEPNGSRGAPGERPMGQPRRPRWESPVAPIPPWYDVDSSADRRRAVADASRSGGTARSARLARGRAA